MPFGQVILGPPGSGKTTYCHGMLQMLTALKRPTIVVNLDPGNDLLPYQCTIDVRDLIDVSSVMEETHLGPNGGLMFAIEYLEQNMDWLEERLAAHKDKYVIFDCPGQVELFSHHNSLKNIFDRLQKLDYRLSAVYLVDAHHCTDAAKFVSVVLLCLTAMMHLSLPHVNVLSKMDLIQSYGKLAFNIDYYTDVMDLDYLLQHIDSDADTQFSQRYRKLNKLICDVVEDYSLVSFCTLDITDKESVLKLLRVIDKSNGYVFGSLEYGSYDEIFKVTACALEWDFERVSTLQEKYKLDEDWEQELQKDLEEVARDSQSSKS